MAGIAAVISKALAASHMTDFLAAPIPNIPAPLI
jgi:hypothetical protein